MPESGQAVSGGTIGRAKFIVIYMDTVTGTGSICSHSFASHDDADDDDVASSFLVLVLPVARLFNRGRQPAGHTGYTALLELSTLGSLNLVGKQASTSSPSSLPAAFITRSSSDRAHGRSWFVCITQNIISIIIVKFSRLLCMHLNVKYLILWRDGP